jgi:hypothetical protein
MITCLATQRTLGYEQNSQRRFAPTSRTADLCRNACRFASESVAISSEYAAFDVTGALCAQTHTETGENEGCSPSYVSLSSNSKGAK